jgi:hypothetical protein
MELTADEFIRLKGYDEEKARHVASLEHELEVARAEREQLRAEREQLRAENEVLKAENMQLHSYCVAGELENLFLKNCIMLSVAKIKKFVMTLDNINWWSFLRSFVTMSLPDELREKELRIIDEMMPLPMPMRTVGIEHADVVVGLAEGGATVLHHINNNEQETNDHGRE